MSVEKDVILATRVVSWLAANGCGAIAISLANGFVEVHYTLKLDIKPQPPIKVQDGGINFPRGSQEAVVQAFFSFLAGD